MTSRDFCYWLQGYFEILGANNPTTEQQALTPAQTAMIGRHLALVFKHEIDPSIDKGDPHAKAVLDALHNGLPQPPVIPPAFPVPVSFPPTPSSPGQMPLRC